MSLFNNNSQEPKSLTALHWHEVYEVLYIRRGWGNQRLNADTMPIYPGDIVFIRPGDLHTTEALSTKGCDVDVLQFSQDFLLKSDYGLDILPSKVIHPEKDNIQRVFDALNEYSQAEGTGMEMVEAGLVQILVGFLMRECGPHNVLARSSAIDDVCTYIEQAQDLRLEQVAAHFGYSPEHLSRKFHKEMTVSYRNWCERIRMHRAIALLNDANNSISFIAETLCYSDESSFIRAFRRMYGITPSAYRRRQISMIGER